MSIIDLSDKASQPMINERKKTVIMFNGEIYNHNQLRKEMEDDGISFLTSHSDTEVVLNGLSYYGVGFVEKLIGQFSIFFLNINNNKVFLIRDRLGQKPLFYKITNSNIVFGTNLKSLLRSNGK